MSIKPYGSTSGRIHGEPGYKVRPSSKTVDAHCHLHVQEAADIVQGLFDQFDVPAFKHSNQITTKQNVEQVKDRFMDLTNVETRLKKMDSQGIDTQVLIPVPFQHYCNIIKYYLIKINLMNRSLPNQVHKNCKLHILILST